MPLASAQTFEKIILRLSVLRYVFKARSKRGLYDLNKHAERFFLVLLNLVEGWNLKNLNDEVKNFAVLDLGDDVQRVSVQVTADSTGEKVYSTVAAFVAGGLTKRFDRLIVLLLTDKRNYIKADYDGNFKFKKSRDIWDIDDLLEKIERMELAKMQLVEDFLAAELAPIVHVLAPRESIFFDAEQIIERPPQTCEAFLISTGSFEPGSQDWKAEVAAIVKLYIILSRFSRKQRSYLAFIVSRGKIVLRHGDPVLVIFFEEIANILNLSLDDNSTLYLVLEDANLAGTDDDFYYKKIGLHYAPNDFDFFPALKKYCTSEEMIHNILVNGDFTLLDN